ncbi:MAG: hypothetical protein DMG61_22840 [Acidobacteria bacterium]|nr:MAG: hypothetical protein DMG61_22840 [Acidobacteriota bacterium]
MCCTAVAAFDSTNCHTRSASVHEARVDRVHRALELVMNRTDIEQGVRNLGRSTITTCKELWHKLTRDNSAADVNIFDSPGSVLQAEGIAELELLSESLQIDKQKIVDGELSIRKEVVTELQTIQVPVTREELVIERRSADGRCTSEVLRGQQQIRIPMSKERVIVSKTPMISEVAKISRRKIVETKSISSPVRHEELRITSEGDAPIVDDRTEAG